MSEIPIKLQNRILAIRPQDDIPIGTTTYSPERDNSSFADEIWPQSTDNATNDYFICAEYPGCKVGGCGVPWKAPIDCGPEFCNRAETILTFLGMGALSLLIITVNILVIMVVLSRPSLRRRHGYIKVSMAISDLLVGMFVIPSAMYNFASLLFYPSNLSAEELSYSKISSRLYQRNFAHSVVFGTINVVAVISSIYNLLLFSIDRFLAIARPLHQKAGENVKKKFLYIWIAGAWIIGIVVSVIPVFFPDNFSYATNPATFVYVQDLTSAEDGSPGTWAGAYVGSILAIPYFTTVLLNFLTMLVTWSRLRVRQRLGSKKCPHGLIQKKCNKKIEEKTLKEKGIVDKKPNKNSPLPVRKLLSRKRQEDGTNEGCGWVSWWKREDGDFNENNNNSDSEEQSPHYQRTRDQITVVRKNPFTMPRQLTRFRLHYSYHIRVFKTIVAMVIAFTICIIPYVAVAVMSSMGALTCDNAARPLSFALYMLFVNSALNFAIYNLWNADFRKQLRGMCRRAFGKGDSFESKPSRTRTSTLSTLLSGFRSTKNEGLSTSEKTNLRSERA